MTRRFRIPSRLEHQFVGRVKFGSSSNGEQSRKYTCGPYVIANQYSLRYVGSVRETYL